VRVEKSALFAIYRLDIDWDLNNNGQPEPNEVAEVAKGNVVDQLGEQISEVASTTGGSPSPLDQEAAIEELKADPKQKVGIYAIIETSAQGQKKVLEVFSVSDREDDSQSDDSRPLIRTPDDSSNSIDQRLEIKEGSKAEIQSQNFTALLDQDEPVLLAASHETTSSRLSGELLLGSLLLLRAKSLVRSKDQSASDREDTQHVKRSEGTSSLASAEPMTLPRRLRRRLESIRKAIG